MPNFNLPRLGQQPKLNDAIELLAGTGIQAQEFSCTKDNAIKHLQFGKLRLTAPFIVEKRGKYAFVLDTQPYTIESHRSKVFLYLLSRYRIRHSQDNPAFYFCYKSKLDELEPINAGTTITSEQFEVLKRQWPDNKNAHYFPAATKFLSDYSIQPDTSEIGTLAHPLTQADADYQEIAASLGRPLISEITTTSGKPQYSLYNPFSDTPSDLTEGFTPLYFDKTKSEQLDEPRANAI